jgi:lactate dehydrogenase-like 2-hydroxyacid dehydrogenase
MLVTPFDRLDAEFFREVSASVKVIATYSAGVDHIDMAAAEARSIIIGFTPGANASATAEIAMLLMLGATRRAYEGQHMVRSGAWRSSSPPILGWQLTDKVLGILGMGSIGQAVARRARGFGMKIHYVSPSRLPADAIEDAIFHENLEDMLPVCNYLSLHAPDTPATHHIINATTLAMLPHGAIIINTARGGLVVDGDLIAALRSGHIAGAGLDVYDGEPLLNQGYIDLGNTFLLPHFGSATVETRMAMAMLCLDTIDTALASQSTALPVGSHRQISLAE